MQSVVKKNSDVDHDVVVIGAGPAGALAAALLKRKGHDVQIIERQQFPRFSIGESLLPHCMEFIEEAGMLDAVRAAGFQYKNGAAFARGAQATHFDFREKFSAGPGTTYQVQRAAFDQVLADEAQRQGVGIRYREEVTAARFDRAGSELDIQPCEGGAAYTLRARFVLDASGYGRVLSRLLDLETPSSLPQRRAFFTHIEDRITSADFDREKILITVHPELKDIWYWLIPFSNGRCSIGVVGSPSHFEGAQSQGSDLLPLLRDWVNQAPGLRQLLSHTVWDTPANTIGGYSANVKQLHGTGYALLGNAAEFLDPVFSSGVTIAMRSASMAAGLLDRQLKGEAVDWQTQFAQPLQHGVDVFRAYVTGWYDGSFQDVIFYQKTQAEVRGMISSILAGYAWDLKNPFVAEAPRRLKTLVELCAR